MSRVKNKRHAETLLLMILLLISVFYAKQGMQPAMPWAHQRTTWIWVHSSRKEIYQLEQLLLSVSLG